MKSIIIVSRGPYRGPLFAEATVCISKEMFRAKIGAYQF